MSQALAPMDRLEAGAAQEFQADATQHRAEVMNAELRTEASVKAARAAELNREQTAPMSQHC